MYLLHGVQFEPVPRSLLQRAGNLGVAVSEFRDTVKPSVCVCGCRRMYHANSRGACHDCGCDQFLKDDGTDGVDDYQSPTNSAGLPLT